MIARQVIQRKNRKCNEHKRKSSFIAHNRVIKP